MADDVKAAIRTLGLFEVFARMRRPLGLSELASEMGMPVSSCLFLVRTLMKRGYLYETARRGGYYPTRQLFEHLSRIIANDPVIERVQPLLSALRDRTGETAALAKIQDARMIYLAVEDSPQIVRPAIVPGMQRPLHSTATGKALLSTLDAPARRALLERAGMPRLTPKTIVSIPKLETEIRAGKERGYYVNDGEGVLDLGAIAIPFMLNGEPYALAVIAPSHRILDCAGPHLAALREAEQETRCFR